jgi:trehalose 6-phosphate synthase
VGGADVVIASNRGPVSFRHTTDGEIVSARGGGGLVSAMSGLAEDGNTVWVCAALSDIDREIADASPDGRLDLAGYPDTGAVEMLAIDPATLDAAYNSIANATLWFVHHEMLDAPLVIDEQWRHGWASYVDYNRQFATAVARTAADNARVLVQDYHLGLLPAMLREERPDVRIAHFTHTPWASPLAFAALPPDVATDLLVGMLGADSLGFHSTRWAEEFTACCADVLGIGAVDGHIEYDGRRTAVRVHPLGVDAPPLLARASEADVTTRRREVEAEIGERQAVVRVDRTEPSKNIVRGIEAFAELLANHPELREHVVHVALAYPSRQDVPAYRRYTDRVVSVADEVNREFATPTWTPVLLLIHDDFARSLATLQAGNVVLINPVRDGMNLVAKESVLLNENAVIVLSTQAGAADQMAEGAVMVDPFDVLATADALYEALTMSDGERRRRHDALLDAATTLTPKDWLQAQLDALA